MLSVATLSDPVTKHMRPEPTRLSADLTVGEALVWLRENPPLGRILYLYVVDRDNRLQGVVPTRRLLLSQPETLLRSIMVEKVVTLPHTATVLDACEFFIQYRFLAIPVVNDEGIFLGVLDVELYTDEIASLGEQSQGSDLFQLIGVHLEMGKSRSVKTAIRARFPWLLCNVGGGLAAAFLSGLYETQLQRTVTLALFIPVVLALAESVAMQSVSLTLQLLHGQRPTLLKALQDLRWEGVTGLGLGVLTGGLVFAAAGLWLWDWKVAVVVLGGIICGTTMAALLGMAVPELLRMGRRDPQLASGPIALAATDMVTLLAYFNLAVWILG